PIPAHSRTDTRRLLQGISQQQLGGLRDFHRIGRGSVVWYPDAAMSYRDLRDFVAGLERSGELKRIVAEVDPRLEITEICDRVLKSGGPALLFEKPRGQQAGHTIPVLANLFGTPQRVALGMGRDSVA